MAFLIQWLMESLQPLLFAACIIFVVSLKFFLKEKSAGKRNSNLPPSPPKLPIIGNLHQLGSMPHLSLKCLAEKFGPIIHLQLGQIPTVVISSAKLAKETMKTHDLALSSRPQFFSAKHILYGCTDIAFSPYGDYWRHVRKICILELLSAKRVQSYRLVREEEVARLVQRVADSYPSTTNLTKMLRLYANDVLCRVVFGRDFSGGGEYDRHGFHQMLEEFQVLLGGFSLADFFPSLEFVNSLTSRKSRLQKTFRSFDKLFDQLLSEHLNPERETEEHKDLVNVLLDIQKNGSGDLPITTDNIKAIILDMFTAGSDTASITLEWGMTELILKPKVMEIAQAEVRNIVGDHRRVVSESDLPHLHYIKAVIKEILRFHPPAPVLVPRESTEDVNIEGYDIPAKTRFFFNAWAIGRDSESWENPDTFQPERFMGSTVDFKGQHFELIPFGVGRRICPGITFGTAVIELALAQLLHSFDWYLPPGTTAENFDMKEVFGLTTHRISDLTLVARPRFPVGHNKP
ncbi:hypothetical protein I3843_11G016300 [Carya illinoinensis]|uniref:Cytochrome P450 n=1 Tax=Carya illinoinensis TaxID=32201 RepID=A0A8T1NZK1_CARIL|nr:cytochrome P450 71AP13-like [Carya illinoinensis]KAG6635061.1 hypothetical protein CIPAW_11G016900 [Carya illinoinensis]KAG7954414.1 hypothetical protein I3843_11G016300 [Carya illinoinensis]